MGWTIQALQEAIWAILIVAGPIVLLAAAIGLGLGIIQTVTNIQDQTTPAAFKIIGIGALLIIGGLWMYGYLKEFTVKTMESAFTKTKEHKNAISTEELERINKEQYKRDSSNNLIKSTSEKIDIAQRGFKVKQHAMLAKQKNINQAKVQNLLQTFTAPLQDKNNKLKSPENLLNSNSSMSNTILNGLDMPPSATHKPLQPVTPDIKNIDLPEIHNTQVQTEPDDIDINNTPDIKPVLPEFGNNTSDIDGDKLTPPSENNIQWY